MRVILQYIRRYFYDTNWKILSLVTFFTAILVYINYQYKLDNFIRGKSSFPVRLIAWYLVFLVAFAFPYGCFLLFRKLPMPGNRMIFLLLLAPMLFAIKITVGINLRPVLSGPEQTFTDLVLYWPILAAAMSIVLLAIWFYGDRDQPLYGLHGKHIQWKPYFIMLGLMIPLIAAASTQAEFLETYPKLSNLDQAIENGEVTWWQKLLFELSYGSDFFTIEFFFRGFLILGFLKWAGKDAILPMACFYCTIHFGKPLGECISSYFGGILLGIIVFHTRSILGGLVVHLGIAWLMELGGYLGNIFTRNP